MNLIASATSISNTVLSSSSTKVSTNVEQQVEQGFDFIEKLKNFVLNNGPDVIAGIITFIIGYYIARFCRNMIEKMMSKANYDQTGVSFFGQIIYYVMLMIFLIAGLNRMGIPTTSFIAGFGAFALAIGLALQNNMSNFASGMLILMSKPFKAGDWVSVDGVEGSVRSIQMLNTTIITKENRTIFIPNSIITSQKLTNSTYMPTRYLKITTDISYNNNHHEAIRIIKNIYKEDPRILNSDHVEIGIKNFGDNAVTLVSYPLVKSSDYMSVFYSVMSEIKDCFDREGIEIPYPQRVVYLQSEENAKKSSEDDIIEANEVDGLDVALKAAETRDEEMVKRLYKDGKMEGKSQKDDKEFNAIKRPEDSITSDERRPEDEEEEGTI